MSNSTAAPGAIAIIGGGACGIALLTQLLKKVKAGSPKRAILLFEKAKSIGPGLAYSDRCQGTRLNMRTETMGLRPDNPNHFNQWMQFKHPEQNPDEYLHRTQYGEYLCYEKSSARESALQLGVNLRSISNEVVALHRQNDGYIITTIDGQLFPASDVVLAMGNFMAPKYSHLADELAYFPFPWPNRRLQLIPQEATVGIIGTRLTAIDVALCLKDNGHTGKINLISPSGRLPKVQSVSPSKEGRHRMFEIARELENEPNNSFSRLVHALQTEIGVDSPEDWASVLRPSADACTELARDIREAESGSIHWQNVINATSSVVERYWQCFSVEEKAQFLAKYQSTWMIYRHAMPLVTARRVLALLSSGQLNVVKLTGRVDKGVKGFNIPTQVNGRSELVDYVVEATGPECNALRVPSKLLHHCLGSQLVESDPFGGIKVDPQTLEASKHLYVIGSLTRGAHFYSTAIDRNVVHAERIVDNIVEGRPRKALHIALFVGTDLCSQLMASKLVPLLIGQGHMPYVFLPAHRASKKAAEYEIRELAFFERRLLQEHIVPFLGSESFHGARCLTVEQLSSKYGILVQHVPNVNDPKFIAQLAAHHVDVGMSIRCYQRFGEEIISFFDAPRQGLLNLHPGSLPQYRGVMTMIRAMYNRERDFGYSLHQINLDWDAGNLIDVQTGPIDYDKAMLTGATELYDVGIKTAVDAFEKISRGVTLPSQPQDESIKGYYTFPTREHLDAYRERKLRLVDAGAMRHFIISNFASSHNRKELTRVVDEAIAAWYKENPTPA